MHVADGGRGFPTGVDERTTRDLTYVVVDEIVGASVGLTLSGWPEIDEQGRLRFTGDNLGRSKPIATPCSDFSRGTASP